MLFSSISGYLAQKEGFEPSRRFYPAYSLSRGAPSASWVLLQIHIKFGGESGIRTHGDFRLAGFQDRFLQPLGHLSIVISALCPNTFSMIPNPPLFVNQKFLDSALLKFFIFSKKACIFFFAMLVYVS